MKFTDVAVSFRELTAPRYLRLSDSAKALHIAMKAWAADQQTDGVVPDVALQLIPGGQDESAVNELVASGLWSSDDGAFATDWTGQILAADAHEIAEKNVSAEVAATAVSNEAHPLALPRRRSCRARAAVDIRTVGRTAE